MTVAAVTPPEPIAWLWDGLIPMACLSLIGGPPGVGKSSLVAGLEVSVAAGMPFLGAGVLEGEVIHVDFDTDLRLQYPWYRRAATGMGVKDSVLERIRYAHPANGLSSLDPARIDQLRKDVISRDVKLVVIGTLVLGGVTFGVVVDGGALEVGGATFVGSTLGIVALVGACTA